MGRVRSSSRSRFTSFVATHLASLLMSVRKHPDTGMFLAASKVVQVKWMAVDFGPIFSLQWRT